MYLVVGILKIRNGINVVVSRRLDFEVDIFIDCFNIGIRKELMFNVKLIVKNIMFIKVRGIMKFFCEVFIIIG